MGPSLAMTELSNVFALCSRSCARVSARDVEYDSCSARLNSHQILPHPNSHYLLVEVMAKGSCLKPQVGE